MLAFPSHPSARRLRRILRCWTALPPLVLAITACDIASPELPSFTTVLNIPFERQELLMEDLAEDEDLLFSDEAGGLYLFLEGDSLRVELEPDLSTELDGSEESFELGVFSLDAGKLEDIEYELQDLYPESAGLPPGTVEVPPFQFDLVPDPRDVEDVQSAQVDSGRLRITVSNDFQVPISGPEPPLRLECEVRDSASGLLIGVLEFPELIPPGGSVEALMNLAGASIPDSFALRLHGGSPGHPGVEDVDPTRILNVAVDFLELRVVEAVAVVGEQAIVESRSVELGDSLRILDADVASGLLRIDLGNRMPIPLQADLVFQELIRADGELLNASLELAPYEEGRVELELEGLRILAPRDEALDALSYRVELTSPGSGGVPTVLRADDRLHILISPVEIAFSRCTGFFPEQRFDLDPVSEELDLPQELSGVHFSEAALVLDVLNELQFPAELSIRLKSSFAAGDSLVIDHVAEIAAADARGAALTRVVLDASNSELPELLSGAPERIELGGSVLVGGDQLGTAAPGQGALVTWSVEAPLRASVDPTEVRRDPFSLDLDAELREDLEARLLSASLIAEVENSLPLDLQVRFLVGADSLSVHANPLCEIGPFTVAAAPRDEAGFASASILDEQEIAVGREELLDLIGQGHFVALAVDLPGTGGEEIAFRPSDFLAVKGILKVEVNSTELQH